MNRDLFVILGLDIEKIGFSPFLPNSGLATIPFNLWCPAKQNPGSPDEGPTPIAPPSFDVADIDLLVLS